MNIEMQKLIQRLKELLIQNKRIEVPKSKNGWYDHKEADPEWICEWNSKVVATLKKLMKF